MAQWVPSCLISRPKSLSRQPIGWISTVISGVVLMLLCLQVQSLAQPDPPLPRKEMRERINTIMIAKLDKYLDLSVEQADQFFPRFRHFTNRPILDPVQRARLVIFSHQFPERVRQLIDDVRQQRMEQNRRNQPPRRQNPPPLGR